MNQSFNTIELDSEQEWIDAVLDKLFQAAQSSINESGRFNIAVSGGSTPGAIFKQWVKDERMSALWKHIVFYWVDERIVPTDHADSNYGNAMVIMGNLESSFRAMYNGTDDIALAVSCYREVLEEIVQEDEMPVFDMILLGMGEDGHTASLFPGTTALQETTEWVVSNKIPQLDTHRITLTYPILHAADQVLVLFNGNSKKQLLEQMKSGVGNYPVYKLIDRKKPTEWIYY